MLVSRYFGARDYGKMKTIVSTSLISFLILSILLGVFGAALATLIAQGISAVFSLLIFFYRIRQYKSPFHWFDRQELHSMLRIAIPSVLQQSTVSIGMMIVQAVVNPFGTQALAGYAATMRVENVFSLIFVSIGNAVSPYVSRILGQRKLSVLKKDIMRPFLIANMVNLAIRLSVALIFAPRFGIAFVWLAVPAGWLANFLISYVALKKSSFS